MGIRQNQTVRPDNRTGSPHAGPMIGCGHDEDDRSGKALIDLLRRRIGRLSKNAARAGQADYEGSEDDKQSHGASSWLAPKCTGERWHSSTLGLVATQRRRRCYLQHHQTLLKISLVRLSPMIA